jgi:ribonuclease HII
VSSQARTKVPRDGTDAPRSKRVLPAVWKLRRHEKGYRERGIRLLAGVDEAGVGPLAGPVVAAAVIMQEGSAIRGVDDSKKVHDPSARAALAAEILTEAVAAGIGMARPREIDRINIYQATLRAMGRAVARLGVRPELVLVDARTIPGLELPQEAHVKGDATFYQIACASLLAKHFRDSLMIRLDRRYPGYGFAGHMGYPTPEHRAALKRLGPCWIHRRKYRGVAEWMQGVLPGFGEPESEVGEEGGFPGPAGG